MKKETLYKISIAILLILNLLQLAGFLFSPKPPHSLGENFKEEAIKILKLDNEQKQKFVSFAKEHHQLMNDLVEEQKKATTEYFDSPSNSLLKKINQIETQKLKITQDNFNKIEALLKPEQKANFIKFKEKALQIILK